MVIKVAVVTVMLLTLLAGCWAAPQGSVSPGSSRAYVVHHSSDAVSSVTQSSGAALPAASSAYHLGRSITEISPSTGAPSGELTLNPVLDSSHSNPNIRGFHNQRLLFKDIKYDSIFHRSSFHESFSSSTVSPSTQLSIAPTLQPVYSPENPTLILYREKSGHPYKPLLALSPPHNQQLTAENDVIRRESSGHSNKPLIALAPPYKQQLTAENDVIRRESSGHSNKPLIALSPPHSQQLTADNDVIRRDSSGHSNKPLIALAPPHNQQLSSGNDVTIH